MKFDSKETDILRLADLAQQHRFTYQKVGGAFYFFDDGIHHSANDVPDYTARGLREALAFAEGFDRAITRVLTSVR
jgi:hypothetical protein